MYTVRRSLHYAYPYFNLVLGFAVLLLGSMAWGIYQQTTAVYEEISPGFYQATNIPEHYPIIATYVVVGLALLVMFPRQYIIDLVSERQRFRKTFTRLPVDKATLFVAVGTVVAVVGIVGIQWLGRVIGRSTAGAIQIFTVVFTLVYYFSIYFILPRHYDDIVNYLNSTGSETTIRFERNRGRIDTRLSGRFQKAQLDFSVNFPDAIVSNRRQAMTAKTNKIKLRCVLENLKGGPASDYHIVDKKERWFLIRGKDVDDCFRQRFSVSGGDSMKLSENFKKRLLNYPKHVDIKLNQDSITYETAYSTTPPYRTREGMILLWVDLLDWHEMSKA